MTDPTEALREKFWLILHEPRCVPVLKGPWPIGQGCSVLREFMRANPTALIDFLTVGDYGPDVQHGPEWLQMADGRSMAMASRHNAQVGKAFADVPAKLLAATEGMERAAAEIDCWTLVIESAVRANQPRNHLTVLGALKDNRAALSAYRQARALTPAAEAKDGEAGA